ncbi:hypothetical protein MCUN1_000018 [Malassezia cuniculi]|uniref:Uncharacterized protein n=1 Tax=Malassezia cuniculi TaxID=948313 RepID=A0AAF0EN91_9BASI|nr:hypothetical protein MCUN1_000018 [Malassezia cuniculi]
MTIRVVMFSDGERRDVAASRLIKIFPAPAGPVVDDMPVDEHEREAQVVGDQQESDKAKIPNDDEQIAALFDGQSEYDGYDDASIAGPSSLLIPEALEPPPSHTESARDVRVDELASPPRAEDELVAAMHLALAPQVTRELLEAVSPGFDAPPPPPEDNVLPSYADAASMDRTSIPRTVLLVSEAESFPPSYTQSAERSFRMPSQSDAGAFPPLYEA